MNQNNRKCQWQQPKERTVSPRPKVQTTPLLEAHVDAELPQQLDFSFALLFGLHVTTRIICFAKALMGKFHTTRGNRGCLSQRYQHRVLRCAPSLTVHLGPLLSLLAIRVLGGLETFPWLYSVSADSGSSKRGQLSPSQDSMLLADATENKLTS